MNIAFPKLKLFNRLNERMIFSALPGDNEIPGWIRDGEVVLIKNFNRCALCPFEFITYGVKGLIVQKYINNDLGLTKLEVSLYRMPDSVKAKKVYDLLGYNLNQIIYLSEDGYEGRIDTSLLFSYMLDLRKGRYYVRIIIDDKRPEAIETIKKFGDLVAHKIKPQEVL